MLLLRLPHNTFQHSQLRPSFAHMLAYPEEQIKRHANVHDKAPFSEASDNSSKLSTSYMYVSEEDDRFLLYTDLPGVKPEDLKVELTSTGLLRIHGKRNKRCQQPVSYDRQFLVDEKVVDSSKITATFSDGSLEIVAPKKKATEPRSVPIVAGKALVSDENENDDSMRKFDVDVPGVKVTDLQVQVNSDDKLVIAGKRKRGGQTVEINRTFFLDSNGLDLDRLGANLEDGVLTVRVPVKAPREGRIIPLNASVNQENHEESSVAIEINTSGPADSETVVHRNTSGSDGGKQASHEETEESFHDVRAEEADPTTEGSSKAISKATTVDEHKEEFEVVPETVKEDNA